MISTLSRKQIVSLIVLGILTIAIPMGVYLAQRAQILKSKAASAPIIEALEIKDSEGNIISCDSNTNPPTCPISTTEVTIRLKNPDALIPVATMSQ